jgi:hypothetical protein
MFVRSFFDSRSMRGKSQRPEASSANDSFLPSFGSVRLQGEDALPELHLAHGDDADERSHAVAEAVSAVALRILVLPSNRPMEAA